MEDGLSKAIKITKTCGTILKSAKSENHTIKNNDKSSFDYIDQNS